MRLRASEVAALESGTVLRLPLPRSWLAELRVGGLHFGQANPVRTGEHRGAQLYGAIELEPQDGHVAQTLGKPEDAITMSVN
jgi:flagellar motor switch protein FliM